MSEKNIMNVIDPLLNDFRLNRLEPYKNEVGYGCWKRLENEMKVIQNHALAICMIHFMGSILNAKKD